MSRLRGVVTHSLIPAQAGRGRSEVQAARVMRPCLKEVGAATPGKNCDAILIKRELRTFMST